MDNKLKSSNKNKDLFKFAKFDKRYKILHQLGKGGGGETYLAQDGKAGGEQVALKCLSPRAKAEGLKEAFMSEMKILRGLNHPNLARLLDFGEEDSGLYYISEFVEGTDFVTACGDRDWNAVFELIVQGAWALHYLHSLKVVHRDLKPDNILVGKVHVPGKADSQDRLQLKIIDFGLALSTKHRRDQAGLVGSLSYLAPEILARQPYTPRADLYAFGVVLYQMSLGKLPFAGEKKFTRYMAALREKEIDLGPLVQSDAIPEGVVEVIRSLVVRDPRKRLQDAEEIISIINRSENESFPLEAKDKTARKQISLSETQKKKKKIPSPNKLSPNKALEKLLMMVRSGKGTEAWDFAQENLEEVDREGDAQILEQYYGAAGYVVIKIGRYEEAREWCRRMAQHPKLKETTSLERELLQIQLAYCEGKSSEAQKVLQFISPERMQKASLEQQTRIKNFQALLAQGNRDYFTAARFYMEGARIAEQTGRKDHQLNFLLNAGSLFQGQGAWRRAYELQAQGEKLARELKHSSLLATLLNNLGSLYLYFGRITQAEGAFLESFDLAKQEGLIPLAIYNLFMLTVGEEARGNWERVEHYLEQALEFTKDLGESLPILQTILAKGYFHFWKNEDAECEMSLDQLREKARKVDSEDYLLQADWLEAKLRIRQGNLKERPIEKWLSQLQADAQSRGVKNTLWQIFSDRGEFALLQEDWVGARKAFQQALQILEEIEQEVPEEYQKSFHRDRKKERIRKALKDKRLKSSEEPRTTLPKTGDKTDFIWQEEKLMKKKAPPPKPVSMEKHVSFQNWNDLIERILRQQDLDTLLAEILDVAIELTDAERGFVIHSDHQALDIRAARDMDKESLKKEEEKISFTIAKEVMRTGQSNIIVDALAEDRFAEARSVHALSLRSVLCVPLRAGASIVGLIYLDNRFRQGVFRQEHLPILEKLSNQASLALEHARLHQENREKIEELKNSRATIQKLNERLEQDLKVTTVDLQAMKESMQREHEEVALKYRYENIIGQSSALKSVLKIMDKVVEGQANVFIFGESGTGKELIAQAIHYNGPRKDFPFISENCSALPENLLESELFGHVRGAFTGAEKDKLGLFHLANHGTLFLDEVGDMSLTMQTKLLRVLQEGEVRQVGGKEVHKVNVRVLCASNKDLKKLVDEEKFRADLYYRLHVMRIELPPLRDRREDIPLLIDHFLNQVAQKEGVPKPKLSKTTLKILMDYPWPGNIRELQNEVQRLTILGSDNLSPEMISPQILGKVEQNLELDFEGGLDHMVAGLERQAITKAMKRFRGNKAKVARALKIGRPTLYAKLKAFDLES